MGAHGEPKPRQDDHWESLVTVLDLIRSDSARTRPELSYVTGLGRTVITKRVSELIDCGLVEDADLAPSTGGRAARELRFRDDAGQVLVADLGATSIAVGLCDLAGNILMSHEEAADIGTGPDDVLSRVEALFDKFQGQRPAGAPPVWGIGIGLPGPVEYAAGRPIAPPIMPGWDAYPVRQRLASRYNVPAWVDNDVNLMALGELRAGLARGEQDMIFVKVGTGIGAGLIGAGHLHRGAQGAAGDIGHIATTTDVAAICRCGNIGCLEAVAGGAALARQAADAVRAGKSRFLAERSAAGNALSAQDVADAAHHGDMFAVELLNRTGLLIGEALATLVNFYNPALIVIGGGVTRAGDLFLAAVRQAVYQRSLPLATRELRIVRSGLGERAGLHGAAFVVIDELFSAKRLPLWLDHGQPAGLPQIADPISLRPARGLPGRVPLTV